MKLIFIGKDGSMGFKRGRTYDCMISAQAGSNRIDIAAFAVGKFLRCPYSSLKKMLENWLEI